MAISRLLTPSSAGPPASQPSLLTAATSVTATDSQPSLLNGASYVDASVQCSYAYLPANILNSPTSQHPLQNERPKHRVEAFLLDGEDLEQPPRRRDGVRGWIKFLLRSLKLLAFRSVVATHIETSLTEEKKVAIRKDEFHLRAAAYGLVIHLLPAGAAIALVVLNSAQYYVGGELAGPSGQDDQKLGALTFVAKLHELLMLASLAAVVFAYFRHELLYGEGLPYGAVFGGLQFKEFSFLYSPELWGAFCAEWRKQRKKWILITLLVACTLLGVSVGPSTNNLMRPRLDWWDAGGTTFWVDATADILQPNKTDVSSSLEHCDVDTGDAACPHGDWALINQQFHSYWPRLEPMGNMPDMLTVTSPLSTRQMTIRHRSTEDNSSSTIWQNAFSSASVQQSVVADGVAEVGRLWSYAAANAGERQRFVFRRDAQYSTLAPQPVTVARCEENVFSNRDVGSVQLSFPIFPELTCDGDSSQCYMNPTNLFTVPENSSLVQTVTTILSTGDFPRLTWVDADVIPTTSNSSIHVVATFPSSTSGNRLVYCCTIDSVYAQAELLGSRDLPKVITGYPSGILGLGPFLDGAQQVIITPAWAELLFPEINSPNATVFTQMVSTAGMWNSSLPSQPYNFPFIVESILSTSVTNGLARSTYNRTMLGTLKGSSPAECSDPPSDWCGGSWEYEMIPKHSLGWGGSAFAISTQDQQRATMFTMHATVNGYAWSSRGMLQKAAITVLAVYSVFAISHFIYLVKSGYTSLAWEKAPEMVSLAMNSKPTAVLRNTGAGIDTLQPYKAKVKIKVGPQGHLEYIFEDSEGYTNFILPNERYA